jgi:cytochrome c
VDKKIVGPAWKDVSKRYAGKADIRSQLIEKVSKGGRGNWTEVVGNVAMPPYHPRVSKENIGKLVDFVLSLAKS